MYISTRQDTKPESLSRPLLFPLNTAPPIVMNPHAVDHNDASAPPNPVLSLPPLLNLAWLLRFRLAVGQPAMSTLGADDEDDIVPEPGLELGDHTAIVTRQRFLEIYNLRLQVPQDVNVPVCTRKGKHHGLLFHEREGLRIDGIECRTRPRGVEARKRVSMKSGKGTQETDNGFFASSFGAWAWSWPMFEKDELRDAGGRLDVASRPESFSPGAYMRINSLVLEKSFWRGMWERTD